MTTQENLVKDHRSHREKSVSAKEDVLVVVAIDFGTTYSGWAYSLVNESRNGELDYETNSEWKTGDGLTTVKTPTAVLFDPNGKFHSFGYDAESKYADLTDDGQDDHWKFFKRFKMCLYCDEDDFIVFNSELISRPTRLSPTLQIKDNKGKRMIAMTVFTESLRFLKQSVLDRLNERLSQMPLHKIHWVLTVPSIWTDTAKYFMRSAAIEAGIPGHLLTFAYEPEAAAVYCSDTTIAKKVDDGIVLSSFKEGDCFLVLDCGGGTVDVNSYQTLENGSFKELHHPTGGPWGGTEIDKKFIQFIADLFGHSVWEKVNKDYHSDVLFLKRQFECKKRTISEGAVNELIVINVPHILFKLYKKEHSTDIPLPHGIQKFKDKLKIATDIIMRFFDETLEKIVKHVRSLLEISYFKNVKTILMVGGFSQARLLRKKIQENFKEMKVIIPPDSILSVIKGALIFGNSPKMIRSRVSPRTYGISVNIPFDKSKHSTSFMETIEGIDMCTYIFKPLVRKGDQIILGESKFLSMCSPTRSYDTKATIGVFSSLLVNPLYVSDVQVNTVGKLILEIPDVEKGKERNIYIQLEFDSTELIVSAHEEGTNHRISGKFVCVL